MRLGAWMIAFSAASSPSSSFSSVPRIISMKAAISASASPRSLPSRLSASIEAEACEMAQPRPVNATSSSPPSRRLA
jgi:hypothetical protein